MSHRRIASTSPRTRSTARRGPRPGGRSRRVQRVVLGAAGAVLLAGGLLQGCAQRAAAARGPARQARRRTRSTRGDASSAWHSRSTRRPRRSAGRASGACPTRPAGRSSRGSRTARRGRSSARARCSARWDPPARRHGARGRSSRARWAWARCSRMPASAFAASCGCMPSGAGRGVTVVNALPIEEYLRGVVPLELNSFVASDAAALQAQAVAARSYTYSRLAEFLPRAQAEARARQPWDLRATVAIRSTAASMRSTPASDRAIRATDGLVMRYGGAVVSAPYHSACGGATASAGELWHSDAEPYLRTVSDRIPGTERVLLRRRAAVPVDAYVGRGGAAGSAGAVPARYASGDAGRRGGRARGDRACARRSRGAAGRGASRPSPSPRTAGGSCCAATTSGSRCARSVARSCPARIFPSTPSRTPTDGSRGCSCAATATGTAWACASGAPMGRARAGQDFRTILRTYYPGTTVEPAE